ncbi:MAG: OmpP1/FadL family transporter [Thiolinea sp.]
MRSKQLLLTPLCAAIILGMAGQASAGGFGVTIQSATVAGNAATGHAMAEDVSAMFYNPALLYSMEGRQINGGVALLNSDVTVTNTGSNLPDAAAGFPVIGENIGEPGGLSVTPSFFYRGEPIMKGLVYGIGVNVPFGIHTEYDKDSFTRYEATESSLKTLNINPAVAYQLNENFEIGAGVNIQVGQTLLAAALDSYLTCQSFVAAGAVPAATCATLGLNSASNAATDGSLSIEATGVGVGANFGAVFRPAAGTTVSLGVRSPVTIDFEGEADFTHSANLAALGDAALTAANLNDQDAESTLEMPASASLAMAHQVNDKLTVHGDITWTQWSSIPEVRVKFPDSALSDTVTDLQWEDTVRYGIGATYQMNEKTRLRAGVAMDPVPTPSPMNRTPRAPSSDNLWLSVGASHAISKHFTIDAGLSLVKPSEASVNYTGGNGYITRADVESDVIGAAVSVNYRF